MNYGMFADPSVNVVENFIIFKEKREYFSHMFGVVEECSATEAFIAKEREATGLKKSFLSNMLIF